MIGKPIIFYIANHTMIMSVPLNKVEVKVLNKFGLKKEDIFDPNRQDAKEDRDAVSYIWVKGYLDLETGRENLSMAIYEATNKLAFYRFKKATKEWADDIRIQINSEEFRTFLNSITQYETEDIDDVKGAPKTEEV